MNKCGEIEFKKEKKIVKKSWHDWYTWLINYIPKPIINSK